MTKLAASIALSIAMALGAASIAGAQDAPKKPADPCLQNVDETTCAASTLPKCRWIPATTVNGKERKARCRVAKGNPCAKLDEASCKTLEGLRCAWVTDALNKKGKPRPPFCRRIPKKK
ncbi:MAG: hypothetical protein KJ622_12160 [Alphaproteobacteria bacterium]|nr:hypothetical protein [Alphaproteobacteria bacterium]